MSDALRTFLAERDEPCPNCGYNLRGLGTSTCPECRHGLVLCLRSVHRGWTSLILTIIGLAFAAVPAFVMVWVVAFIVLTDSGGISRDELKKLVVYPGLTALIFGVLLRFVCGSRARARFLRWSLAARTSAAAAAWLASIVVIVTWVRWVI